MASIEQWTQELAQHVHAIVVQQRALEAQAATSLDVELSRQELLAIEMLGENGPSIMRGFADQLYLAVNTVTTLVDNLERRELVRRERDENDRRLVWVHLTEKGDRLFAALLEERRRLCRAMLDPLTEDEQQIYLVITRKIARAAREFVAQGPGIEGSREWSEARRADRPRPSPRTAKTSEATETP